MKKPMKMLAAALALMMALSGCGNDDTIVPVVRVSMLTQAGAAADSYAGVVISENAVQVQRDMNQTISELYVSEGEEVREGQKLFSYDSDELNLTLDRQELDLDRLEQEITAKKKQITDVEKELKTATGDTKTQLNIQLRQLQTELTQAEYDEEDLESEIKYTRQMLRNVDVKSPISGTVRKIDEGSSAYITIQQAGAYQVQGQINELNLNAGITAGTAVTVVSRLDPEKVWSGTVTLVDYNNVSTNSYDTLYGNADPLSSSTSYPFYVSLDSTDGLLLGQHVYIRLAGLNDTSTGRILMPESYLMDISYDEKTLIASANVWCPDEDGRLVKQPVVLGEYMSDTGCYVILDGLTLDGYVADPTNPDCREGVATDLRAETDYAGMPAPATVPAGTDAEAEDEGAVSSGDDAPDTFDDNTGETSGDRTPDSYGGSSANSSGGNGAGSVEETGDAGEQENNMGDWA